MQVASESTLVVILGASQFPKISQVCENKAFKRSAEDFKAYLLDKQAFALPNNNLLDLFDSKEPTTEQDEHIRTFIQKRIKELKDSNIPATDLVLYYVGHGGFFSPNDQYFL